MGNDVQRVDRAGEGGDEVRKGSGGDKEGEEESRQLWTRKRACGMLAYFTRYQNFTRKNNSVNENKTVHFRSWSNLMKWRISDFTFQ